MFVLVIFLFCRFLAGGFWGFKGSFEILVANIFKIGFWSSSNKSWFSFRSRLFTKAETRDVFFHLWPIFLFSHV